MSGRALRLVRPYFVSVTRRPRPPSDVTTLRSVVQVPCGSTVTVNVSPCSSTVAGAVAEIVVSRRNVSR